MDHQKFGVVETETEEMRAMLCIDMDRPDEFLVQLWGQDSAFAVLLQGTLTGSTPATFTPISLYRVNDSGGLWLPQLSKDEYREFAALRVELAEVDGTVEGRWTGSDGKSRAVKFPKPESTDRIEATQCSTWDDFKTWTADVRAKHDAAAFRGHGDREFRLRTTLHRAGRTRIERFCAETLHEFRAHAEAVMGTRFDLNNPDDYSVVLGLAQHHGLPTPLLDWTGSPYIAAFFAFSDAMEMRDTRQDATHVRIYAMTRSFIKQAFSPVVVLPFKRPYIVPLSVTPRQNPRLYAQQGQFLVTNVDDVERFILRLQQATGETIVHAADIPISCASTVLEDLAFMGLTAATMFPGMDGVCRMMRHAMTFKQSAKIPSGEPSLRGSTGE